MNVFIRLDKSCECFRWETKKIQMWIEAELSGAFSDRHALLWGDPKWYMLLVFPLDGTVLCPDNSLWAVQQFNFRKNL